MYYFLFICRSALDDLKKNKMRTILTSLGILIGISAVILLTAFGLGLKKYIEDQFKSLGVNLVMILPGKGMQGGLRPGGGMLGGARFDEKDVRRLKKIDGVIVTAPMFVKYVEIKAEGNSEIYEIIGATEDVFPAFNMELDVGKYFTKADVEKKSKVIVLGSGPAEKIWGGAQKAMGKIAKIEDQAFRVIGVSKSKGGGFGGLSIDDHAYIPYKAGSSLNPDKKFFAVYLKTETKSQIEKVKEEAQKILDKRYSEDDFTVSDQTEMLDMLSSIFNIINFVLIGIATISLIVGGVGVMNIMYVSVAEKVKEIGIRRAVGATGEDILFQFLAEAVLLSLFGGVLALVLSWAVVFFVRKSFPAYIDIKAVLVALGASSLVGIVFGVLPAKRASNLSPIEAIRK